VVVRVSVDYGSCWLVGGCAVGVIDGSNDFGLG
jgi:hypothetical protein